MPYNIIPQTVQFDPFINSQFFEDFASVNGQTASPGHVLCANFNAFETGAAAQIAEVGDTFGRGRGIARAFVSAVGNIVGIIQSNNAPNFIRLGGGDISIEWRVRPANSLSTAGDRYQIWCGLDDAQWGAQLNAVHFTYNDALGPTWFLETMKAGVNTTQSSGVIVNVLQWYRLKLLINAAGTVANFFIDGNFVGSINTNMPATNIQLSIGAAIQKIVGASVMQFDFDYCNYFETFSNGR